MLENLNKWFNLKYEVIYFYNVYGPNQISSGPMATVIGIFEEQWRSGKKCTVVSPGNQSRDFTHVEDVVEGGHRIQLERGGSWELRMQGPQRERELLDGCLHSHCELFLTEVLRKLLRALATQCSHDHPPEGGATD